MESAKDELPHGLPLSFYRAPAPPGRSRESRIVLDREGTFRQDGERFEHAKLAEAFHTWITRHPDDGRYILCNGLDWSYFTVESAPYFVRALGEDEAQRVLLRLSDGTSETLRADRLLAVEGARLQGEIKADAFAGPYPAEFTRHALASLGEYMVEQDGAPALWINAAGEAVRPGAATAVRQLPLPAWGE